MSGFHQKEAWWIRQVENSIASSSDIQWSLDSRGIEQIHETYVTLDQGWRDAGKTQMRRIWLQGKDRFVSQIRPDNLSRIDQPQWYRDECYQLALHGNIYTPKP